MERTAGRLGPQDPPSFVHLLQGLAGTSPAKSVKWTQERGYSSWHQVAQGQSPAPNLHCPPRPEQGAVDLLSPGPGEEEGSLSHLPPYPPGSRGGMRRPSTTGEALLPGALFPHPALLSPSLLLWFSPWSRETFLDLRVGARSDRHPACPGW